MGPNLNVKQSKNNQLDVLIFLKCSYTNTAIEIMNVTLHRCSQSTSHVFPALPVTMGHHVEVNNMDFAPHGWMGEWLLSNTHPSPMGAKYKKAQLEQEKKHVGQEDRSPMGANKKLKASISKEETKAQQEP